MAFSTVLWVDVRTIVATRDQNRFFVKSVGVIIRALCETLFVSAVVICFENGEEGDRGGLQNGEV